MNFTFLGLDILYVFKYSWALFWNWLGYLEADWGFLYWPLILIRKTLNIWSVHSRANYSSLMRLDPSEHPEQFLVNYEVSIWLVDTGTTLSPVSTRCISSHLFHSRLFPWPLVFYIHGWFYYFSGLYWALCSQ